MTRQEDLEKAIAESYDIIRQYDIICTSDRPEERTRARRVIEEQRALIKGYQAELLALTGDANVGEAAGRESSPEPDKEAGADARVAAQARPRHVKDGHIFISYSHKDSNYARRLEGELRRRGFEVWIDDRIHYGTRWPHVIQEHLDTSAAVIVIMTPRSYSSEWVQNELVYAANHHKTIFPLLLEGDYWLSVAATQCVDVTDDTLPPPAFYDQLGRALSLPITPPPPPSSRPRLLLRWMTVSVLFLLTTIFVPSDRGPSDAIVSGPEQAIAPVTEFEAALLEGREWLEKGEPTKADDRFQEAANRNEESALPWFWMARSALAEDNQDRRKIALDYLNKALNREPGHEPSQVLRIKVLLLSGKKREAQQLAQEIDTASDELSSWLTCLENKDVFAPGVTTETDIENKCSTHSFMDQD